MSKEKICDSILKYLSACKPVEIVDRDASIFCEKQRFEARDLVYVCLRMKEQYGCDLNKVVGKIKTSSVNELTEAFWSAIDE